MEAAIVGLHRAEILTHQSRWLPTSSKREDSSAKQSEFGKIRRRLLEFGDGETANLKSISNAWKSMLYNRRFAASSEPTNDVSTLFPNYSPLLHDGLSLLEETASFPSRSYLEDAWQSLSRAEHLIRKNRKNVWWVTWLFELKLKVVELKIYSTVTHREADFLPFIGLGNAPFGTLTTADMLLENTVRVVRYDVFRLARMLEAYANALLGLLH